MKARQAQELVCREAARLLAGRALSTGQLRLLLLSRLQNERAGAAVAQVRVLDALLRGRPRQFTRLSDGRWALAAANGAPHDSAPAAGQIEELRERRESPITLPRQVAKRPPFEQVNVLSNAHLTSGKSKVSDWPSFYSKLNATLRGANFRHVHIAWSQAPRLSLHIRIVIDETPWFVAYAVNGDRHLVARARDDGWHTWPVEAACAWDQPTRLDVNLDLSEWVLSWRAGQPLELARAATILLMREQLNPARAKVKIQGLTADEAAAFKAALETLEQRRKALDRPGWSGWKHPVAGHCLLCSRPLRDPLSVHRGIGPECWENFRKSGATFHLSETRTDIPAEYWAVGASLMQFQSALADDVRNDLQGLGGSASDI